MSASRIQTSCAVPSLVHPLRLPRLGESFRRDGTLWVVIEEGWVGRYVTAMEVDVPYAYARTATFHEGEFL